MASDGFFHIRMQEANRREINLRFLRISASGDHCGACKLVMLRLSDGPINPSIEHVSADHTYFTLILMELFYRTRGYVNPMKCTALSPKCTRIGASIRFVTAYEYA